MNILAKSKPERTLKEHIDDCLEVCSELESIVPKATNILNKDFWGVLRLCLICHDLGKAHIEFQKLLSGKPNNWESQRHELFSASITDCLDIDNSIKELVKYIIVGHHKDYKTLSRFYSNNYKTKREESFSIFTQDKKDFLEETQEKISLLPVKELLCSYNLRLNNEKLTSPISCICTYLKKELSLNDDNFLLLMLLLGAFKHCDHLASGGVNKLHRLTIEHFSYLYESKYSLYNHQYKSSQSHSNVILTAPTGSGKTESAMLWLENQIKANGQGRAYYILPYTASINAMYERLAGDFCDNKLVGVVHGKLSEYIEHKFSEEKGSSVDGDYKKKLIQSFKSIETPIKVATPFQLIKGVFGVKGYEKLLFEWTGGYFIFDEIHAYRPSVFAQILILIKFAVHYLGTKVFIMTATMPLFLRKELEAILPDKSDIVADRKLYDSFKRHKVEVIDDYLSSNIELINRSLSLGKKVLIVCNTIKSAQNIYEQIHYDNKVLLHSAFNSRDRNKIEKKVNKDQIQLLIGTQAIEVSLDIDYDVIFTESAPLDALIQRFGRVNRRREKGLVPCYVFSKRNKSDYFVYKDSGIIDRTIESLKEIQLKNSGIIDELQLQLYIDKVYPAWSEEDKKEFSIVYDSLNMYLNNDFRPFIDEGKEGEFYKQFNSEKVLPKSLCEEYQRYFSNNEFIRAESLKVQISDKKFKILSRKRVITQEFGCYVVNCNYNEELGLKIEEVSNK
ncbi:MAG: CRISPR-associated helicase Cas3' [Hyphomicrobiales bacterium]